MKILFKAVLKSVYCRLAANSIQKHVKKGRCPKTFWPGLYMCCIKTYISVKFFCALAYIQTPFPFEILAFHGRGRLYTGYVFFSKRNDEKTSQSMVNFFVQLVLCFCHQSLPQRFNIVLIIDDHCHFFLISLREQTVARDQ